MKKTILLLMILVMASMVMAFTAPPAFDFQTASISQPVPPSTGGGQCEPWETKDYFCEGQVSHYTQCVKTVDGGVWQPKAEDCQRDFPENVCSLGKCKKPSDAAADDNMTLYIIIGALVLIIIYALGRKK